VGTQIHPAAPKSEHIEGPHAHSFIFVLRDREIRHTPRGVDDCNVPSRLSVPVSCRPGGILFHDQQAGCHRSLDGSRAIWDDLLDHDDPRLRKSGLPISYADVWRVVVPRRAYLNFTVDLLPFYFWFSASVVVCIVYLNS